MKKYTTVLFDLDNTLLNFDEDERTALSRTLEQLGIEPTDEIIKTYSGINARLWRSHEKGNVTKSELKVRRFRRLFERLEFEPPVPPEQVNSIYEQRLSETGTVISGAFELCERLKEAGLELYIVTNGLQKTQSGRLKNTGFDKLVNGVFISETIGFQKPFKDYFNYVFEHINEKDKSRIILVGDSLGSDIKGAADSGIDSLWINFHNYPNNSGYRPTYVAKKPGSRVERILTQEA